jgi:hypothetical protein
VKGANQSVEWTLVYDLAVDVEHVRQVQDASLHRPGFGFPPEPFLFGSPEWWQQIESGAIPTKWVEGLITDVYWASMADWPEFRMRSEDGTETTWTRMGDARRYVEGLHAKISYVELEWKKDAAEDVLLTLGPTAKVELKMWVEESPLRSPAVAPGPGGVGYELEGGPGTVLHYLRLPDQERAGELAKTLEGQVADVHVYPDGAGVHWFVRVKHHCDFNGGRETVRAAASRGGPRWSVRRLGGHRRDDVRSTRGREFTLAACGVSREHVSCVARSSYGVAGRRGPSRPPGRLSDSASVERSWRGSGCLVAELGGREWA